MTRHARMNKDTQRLVPPPLQAPSYRQAAPLSRDKQKPRDLPADSLWKWPSCQVLLSGAGCAFRVTEQRGKWGGPWEERGGGDLGLAGLKVLEILTQLDESQAATPGGDITLPLACRAVASVWLCFVTFCP